MKKTTLLIGGIAIVSTITFLLKSSSENGNKSINNFDGINIDVDSDKIINRMANSLDLNGRAKEVVGNIAKKAFAGYIDQKLGR